MHDIDATKKMIRKLKLDSIGIAIATPFPGTKWWKIAVERGLIPPEIDWSRFDFDQVPVKLNNEFSIKQLKSIQKNYYWEAAKSNPKYLLNIISSFVLNPHTFKRRISSILGFSGN